MSTLAMSQVIRQHRRIPSWPEKRKHMTMQIGMVGTDGVLIARDRRAIVHRGNAEVQQDINKIVIGDNSHILVTAALADTAIQVAKEIGRRFKPRLPRIDVQLKCIVDELMGEEYAFPDDVTLEFLVVERERPDCIFQLDVRNGMATCSSSNTVATAGHSTNAAVFFLNRYYEKRLIKDLTPLAAHVLTAAKQLNSYSIDGCDIWLCRKSGFVQLPDCDRNSLVADSETLDREICKMLRLRGN